MPLGRFLKNNFYLLFKKCRCAVRHLPSAVQLIINGLFDPKTAV